MPNTTFPTVDMNKTASDINAAFNEVNDAIRDAIYIAVGFGVLAFQKAQVRRVELSKQFESQLQGFNGVSAAVGAQAEEVAKAARAQSESLRSQLAEQFGEITKTLEEQFESIRDEAAELAKSLEERLQPIRKQVDEQLDRLDDTLPPGARGVVQSLRSAAAAQEQLLRGIAGTN